MTRVVSFDGLAINDGVNYTAALKFSRGLPASTPQTVERTGADALVGGIKRPAHQPSELGILIVGENVDSLRTSLYAKFNPRDAGAKALVIRDDDEGNERYIMCQPQAFDQQPSSFGTIYVATLVVHDDVAWRDTVANTQQWGVTASGQTVTVSNGGDLNAYPKFTITPTSAKPPGNGNPYRRFAAIYWSEAIGVNDYPVDIADNALDTQVASTNFASATGDDVRIVLDGDSVDFWIQDPDTATTQIWVNLDFKAGQSVTLATAIAASGSISTIDAASSIADFPESGILMIDSEIFTYTGRNLQQRQFTGVVRAAKGSSMAAHTTADTVKWIQHELWITYGDSTLSAHSPDDDFKPAFRLDSTNDSWDYDDFGADKRKRTASWRASVGLAGNAFTVGYAYTRDHSSAVPEMVSPWEVIGLAQQKKGSSRWFFHSPRGISAANFQSGKVWSELSAAVASFAEVQSSSDGQNWTTEYDVPATSAADTWYAWSQNVTGLYTADQKETEYVALWIEEATETDERYKVQAADVTITHQRSLDITDIGEISSNYPLSITLTNNTTGQAIEIDLPMDLNASLEIDTDARTVKITDDNTNMLAALTLVDGARTDWLPLQPGTNELQYDETGAAAVTVDIEWKERWYD